jgi:hypothetical protein
MKLFTAEGGHSQASAFKAEERVTLDDSLVIKKIGKLATSDCNLCQESLQQLFNL